MIPRRSFVTLLGGAAVAWPVVAGAQQNDRMRHVGVLMSYASDDPEARIRVEVLERRLAALGWIEGRNLKIDYNWAPKSDAAALRSHARQLIASMPELIVSNSTPVLAALRSENQTIPLVFVQVTDPVGAGFVRSLARPGGNTTGFTDFEYAIGGKWIELLKEMRPALARVAVIVMPNHVGNAGFFDAMQKAAPVSGVSLIRIETHDIANIERALINLSAEPNSGLILLPSPLAIEHRDRVIALAAQHRILATYPLRYFAESGGLMSYGIDQVDQWLGAANYVDRILKGERPTDLPVQQPSKFQLVINLKTAKQLGLTVPPQLLARADEVIE